MTARAPVATPTLRPGGLDPFRTTWRLLTNAKFALTLIGLAAFACLLGVVLPQMPGPMRDNAAARSAWLELRREDFGPFTASMDRAGLFEIFQTPWFVGFWVLVLVSVACFFLFN